MSGPLDGFRPAAPPPELRERVLAAARDAAAQPSPRLLELLLADRTLRLAATIVLALFLAQLLVDRPPVRMAAPVTHPATDEASAPAEPGLTAAEQIDELEPAL
jgi:hypothetical protein